MERAKLMSGAQDEGMEFDGVSELSKSTERYERQRRVPGYHPVVEWSVSIVG